MLKQVQHDIEICKEVGCHPSRIFGIEE